MVGFRKSRSLIGVAGRARPFVHETLVDRYSGVGGGRREGVTRKAVPGKGEQQEKQEGRSSHRC